MPEPPDSPHNPEAGDGLPDNGTPTPSPRSLAHDLLDPAAQFDPTQWAMHGLLSVYFEGDEADQTHKADAILARIATELGKTPVPAEASVPCGTGVPPVGSPQPSGTGVPPILSGIPRRSPDT